MYCGFHEQPPQNTESLTLLVPFVQAQAEDSGQLKKSKWRKVSVPV